MCAFTDELPKPSTARWRTTPRKGASHTWNDIGNQIVDVIIHAISLVELQTLDGEKILATRLAAIAEPSGLPG
ncbi:hypothetical protein [Actinomadura chibensis]|uniref:Uncharacterized protein n=1 Tax=Actinomadura chibensis TaxID=392828 RepID=A0A5D0N728_9ACTN|nr:hypothetical protein [Actinomadura chibensis]TYB40136.1 hypothetical protein FXF69_39800 [Actinomadura chibensis]